MSEAQRKLKIAKFNLDQMVKSAGDFQSLMSYLDSFLSSARSVTWILQKEFSDKPGFGEWYKTKRKNVDQENDFDLFVKLRNTSIKERNIYPNPSVSATDTIHFVESYVASLYDKNGNLVKEVRGSSKSREIPKEEKKIRQSFVFEERPWEDGLLLCARYYSKLEDIVNECEQKFSC